MEVRAAGHAILDLTVTDPGAVGLGPPEAEVRDALSHPRALRHEPDPRGLLSAREAAAEYLGARAGVALSPDRVFLTASTSEAYSHLFRLLCEPGDEVLAPRPSYPLIEPIARLEDVQAHAYRLAYDGQRWRLDLDSLEASITTRTRAVVLVEPNNPTGSRLTDGEFARVEAICAERGLALISDEVFGDIVWEPGAKGFPGRLGKRAAPTFVLGGISKPCGLPQLKLGWIAAEGPAAALSRLLPRLEWILDLFLSVGAPVQWALPRLLPLRHAYQSVLAARLRENLGSIERAAGGHPEALVPYRGEGGLSTILRVARAGRTGAGEDFAEWALRERDVYVHPAHYYDLDRDDLIVVSLLTPPDVLREALGRLLE